jgi:hypothetical protein
MPEHGRARVVFPDAAYSKSVSVRRVACDHPSATSRLEPSCERAQEPLSVCEVALMFLAVTTVPKHEDTWGV